MIRICHIITKLELGGAQQNTIYTVANLDRARFEASLVAGSDGLLVEEARASGVPVHLLSGLVREISPLSDARALASLYRLLSRERPDIVHTHSSKAGILGRWAARLAGVPHIVHSIHGFGFTDRQRSFTRRFYVALERMTGRATTSAFVAVSRANMETGLSLGLFRADRVTLIRSGVRLSDFAPAPGPRDEERPLTVGMIACMKPQKAPLDFVRVAARVIREAGPDLPVRFLLVGDGNLRAEVEDLVRREGLSDKVTLAGWRRDIPEILRRLDLLLHTSLWEGLPRVFPEAMATGLPIVATRVDGAPEAIEEGITGFLLPPGDIDGMARCTLRLLRDPDLRRRMGHSARGRIAPWDIDEMVRRQERLYEGLVSGEAARAVALSTQMEGR